MVPTQKAFAEIIESSIMQATGLCWDWAQLPTLCGLVKITQAPYVLYGCITNVTTGNSDPVRQPFAYKKTEAELLQEQPQIFAFLQTSFTIKILGYQKEKLHYLLPPQPTKLHSFVEYATADEYKTFFEDTNFLNLFCMPSEQGIDNNELLLVLLQHLQNMIKVDAAFIHKICSHMAAIQSSDYRATKRFLQRVQQLL